MVVLHLLPLSRQVKQEVRRLAVPYPAIVYLSRQALLDPYHGQMKVPSQSCPSLRAQLNQRGCLRSMPGRC